MAKNTIPITEQYHFPQKSTIKINLIITIKMPHQNISLENERLIFPNITKSPFEDKNPIVPFSQILGQITDLKFHSS